MNAEEAGLDGSIRGDAFEWFGEALSLIVGRHFAELLGHAKGILRERVGGENSARDQGRKQRATRQTRGVMMVFAYMGVVIRDAHNFEPPCAHCTGSSVSLFLNPRSRFVRMIASLTIISSRGRVPAFRRLRIC